MTPCTPRTWSERRLAASVLCLLGASIGTGVALSSVIVALTTAVAILGTDFIAALVLTRRATALGRVTLSVRAGGERDLIMTDAPVRVIAEVETTQRVGGALVVPVLPPALSGADDFAARGTLRAHTPVTMTFHLRAVQPGVAVVPGVIVRRPSPFRFFSIPALLLDRREIVIQPNYATTSHPALAAVLQPIDSAGHLRRRVLRGFGTDFHELRAYRRGDPRKRIDWKATARRRTMLVREYEEPLDHTIRVVLDASIDMMHDRDDPERYGRAADFVARLAFVAWTQGLTLGLTTYDDTTTHQLAMRPVTAEFHRLLAALVAAPRRAIEHIVQAAEDDRFNVYADRIWHAVERHWGGRTVASTRPAFIRAYLDESLPPPHDGFVHFLADLSPGAVATAARQDPDRDPAQRGRTAVTALARALRASRGRETFIYVSALAGGECNESVLRALLHAAAGHRHVHVVVPGAALRAAARPDGPGFLGMRISAPELSDNLGRLESAERFRTFRERLIDANVHVHALDDRTALDDVVLQLFAGV